MPEILDNIQAASKEPTGWLSPNAVDGLLESDFHTLKPEVRERLFHAVEQFRTIAALPSPTPEQRTEARAAFDTVLDIVRPYLTPESTRVRDAIAKVWRREREWMLTFDYELGANWLDKPVVWLWFVIKDDALPEDFDAENEITREGFWRVRSGLLDAFNEAGIERWPNNSVITESDVRELQSEMSE